MIVVDSRERALACCSPLLFPPITLRLNPRSPSGPPVRPGQEELDLDAAGKTKTKPIASGKYGRIEWALFPQERIARRRLQLHNAPMRAGQGLDR